MSATMQLTIGGRVSEIEIGEKTYSTGSTGYAIKERVNVGDKVYFVNVTLVDVTAKANAKAKAQAQKESDTNAAKLNTNNRGASVTNELTQTQIAKFVVNEFGLSLDKALEYAAKNDERLISAAKEYYAAQVVNAPVDDIGNMLNAKKHVPSVPSMEHSTKNMGARKTADGVQASVDTQNELKYPTGKVKIACVVNGKTITMNQDKLNKSAFLKTLVSEYDTQVLQSFDGKLTRALVSGVDDLQANSAPRFDSMVRRNFVTVTPR